MTVNDLVTAVLAFVRMNGAIGAVAWLTAALVASLAVLYLSAKVAARVSVRKSFDVGGSFDHFYSRILPAARPDVVYLIGAGYAGLWLSAWPAGNCAGYISLSTASLSACWLPSSSCAWPERASGSWQRLHGLPCAGCG